MTKTTPPRPVLMFNSGPQDREAFELISLSEMPCEFIPSGNEKIPILIDGYEELQGIDEIRSFVEEWKISNSPR